MKKPNGCLIALLFSGLCFLISCSGGPPSPDKSFGNTGSKPNPEQTEKIDGSSFKTIKEYTLSDHSSVELQNMLDNKKNFTCDESAPHHPKFGVGVFQDKKSSLVSAARRSIEYRTRSVVTKQQKNISAFEQEVLLMKFDDSVISIPFFSGKTLSDYNSQTLKYKVNSRMIQNEDPNNVTKILQTDATEKMARNFTPDYFRSFSSAQQQWIQQLKQDFTQCKLTTTYTKIRRLAEGLYVLGSREIEAFYFEEDQDAIISCRDGATLKVQLVVKEVRSHKVISPEGEAFCNGATLVKIMGYYDFPGKRLILVSRDEVIDASTVD